MTFGAPFRRLLAAACAVLGAVLVVVAFASAGAAPQRAHDDSVIWSRPRAGR
jgi:hypothetical protein